jgi:hypothetical protein
MILLLYTLRLIVIVLEGSRREIIHKGTVEEAAKQETT